MGYSVIGLALTALAIFLAKRNLAAQSRRRDKRLTHTSERVLILGASSGVGRAVAKRYASRGARVCVVARRADDIATLSEECGEKCIWHAADFSHVDDLISLRARLEEEWQGLDTLHICAGVSALQPIMALTGTNSSEEDADAAGIQRAVDIAGRAVKDSHADEDVRVTINSSRLFSCRGYSGTDKGTSLAIEHPKIAFAFILPATIEGNFRASAVDSGTVREDDPNKHGLRIDYVAEKCIDSVDRGITGNVVLPKFPYAIAQYLYLLWPTFIEARARKKYNFKA
ncbi:dehydrogenase/reductase SDR family protein 7-like [Colletotrichum spaethianum]|uniref:Dehydrogenase/reductase SDR family protein 7-like n=1 Tax=Colletotrichum spaethianum TaxID=700344 RepID=A0AA37PCG8_9PEZI|nr:dehydrogenase/reductase SDR family protein 7-like [Colletotrichum spaethianum]GKT49654.1 dehydrogenase/reductase SDR family protein 7-like [Colletotrichum spaethianum]